MLVHVFARLEVLQPCPEVELLLEGGNEVTSILMVAGSFASEFTIELKRQSEK